MVGAELAISARMGEPRDKNLRKDASSFQEWMGGWNELHFSGWKRHGGNMGREQGMKVGEKIKWDV